MSVTDITDGVATMHVFVTGASGFIGTAVVRQLAEGGHRVTGLARSDAAARAVAAAGAEVHRGSVEDHDSLRSGAAAADGVVHLAFNHDFSQFERNCENDRLAIEALASALAGSDRPLIVTGGIGVLAPGRLATEEDDPVPASEGGFPRNVSEEAAEAAAARGVRASIVRLPQVHDPERQGLITWAIALAVEKGASPYVGAGTNRWPAVHRSDAARLYRLAIEKGEAGVRYHAVGEEGVSFRAIAEAVGRRVGVPATSIAAEEAESHYGWLTRFALNDMPASSARTQARLDWRPVGPGLIEDLDSRPLPAPA